MFISFPYNYKNESPAESSLASPTIRWPAEWSLASPTIRWIESINCHHMTRINHLQELGKKYLMRIQWNNILLWLEFFTKSSSFSDLVKEHSWSHCILLILYTWTLFTWNRYIYNKEIKRTQFVTLPSSNPGFCVVSKQPSFINPTTISEKFW